jgi:hypothetical protein
MPAKGHIVCTNCVMDTTDSLIRLILPVCAITAPRTKNETLPNWHKGERGQAELDRMIANIPAASTYSNRVDFYRACHDEEAFARLL